VPSAAPPDLASIPLFRSLTEPELAEVAPWFDVRDAGSGERLVGEGATGHLFFVVSEGEVSVTGFGQKVASLGPGEFFGEMALLGYRQHLATVTTASPARLLVLSGDDFDRLRAKHPDIAAEVQTVMQKRLAQLP
jgi:CRP-like cAMP-binding protein